MIIQDNTFNQKKFNTSINKDQSINDKKAFYEIGCKIFEINKFYKKD
jgi:hypothetical protein